MPDSYPTKKELRARERWEPDWHDTIHWDSRGGVRLAGADDTLMRLAPSGSRHLSLSILEEEQFQCGIIVDAERARWLAARLLAWADCGRLDEGTEDGQT
jgi:hypothetical protein